MSASPTAIAAFQAVATLLVAAMVAQFARMLSWRYARQWVFAWGALSIAAGALWLVALTEARVFWFLYLAGRWGFAIFLFAGCRELGRGEKVNLRAARYGAPVAAIAAAILVAVVRNAHHLLALDSVVLAAGFLTTSLELRRFAPERHATGWRTLRVVVAALAVQHAIWTVLYAIAPIPHANSVDLLGFMLLAFSMMFITHEETQRETIDGLTALQVSRDHLERKSRVDPLTEAFNRHAFHVLSSGNRGSVVMIDIDQLKAINDCDGHVVGDAVIRAAAREVRNVIRPDDLLFRWGGDEFLLLMPDVSLSAVADRLDPLGDGVLIEIPGVGHYSFHVSWGGAEFGQGVSLQEALKQADEEMYQRRRERRKVV